MATGRVPRGPHMESQTRKGTSVESLLQEAKQLGNAGILGGYSTDSELCLFGARSRRVLARYDEGTGSPRPVSLSLIHPGRTFSVPTTEEVPAQCKICKRAHPTSRKSRSGKQCEWRETARWTPSCIWTTRRVQRPPHTAHGLNKHIGIGLPSSLGADDQGMRGLP